MSYVLDTEQEFARDFMVNNDRVCQFSDAGTGKTATVLTAAQERDARLLVIAPKAILETAWVEDCQKFTPNRSIEVAWAKNRMEAFKSNADIIVTNHDAAAFLRDNPKLLKDFDMLAMDESTAFKNPTSQRSKSMAYVKDQFDVRVAMSGDPMIDGLKHIWHQAYLVDDGSRLGDRYYRFLYNTHDRKRVTRTVETWIEREGMREVAASLLQDITVRFELKGIPLQRVHRLHIKLPARVLKAYESMLNTYRMQWANMTITAANAAVMSGKLLQLASGALYDEDGCAQILETAEQSRYELIAQLCLERHHTLVAFNWAHQRDGITKALEKVGIHRDQIGVIDGSTSSKIGEIVQHAQGGDYRVVLVQPQSGAHGLTLTKFKSSIWASPLASRRAELFKQFGRRTRRRGQDEETEVICISAKDTIEDAIYDMIDERIESADTSFMSLINTQLFGR